jgi:hypothetical protein
MHIPTLINNILRRFNVALCKRTTLEKLHQQEPTPHKDTIVEKVDNLSENSRLQYSELNKKIDQLRDELLQHQTYLRWSILDDIRHLEKNNQARLQCPLCEFEGKKESFVTHQSSCIFQGGDLIRFQCPDCELIFGDQKMLSLTAEALSYDYEWHYKTYSEGDSTELEIRTFQLLKPKKSGVYLNYGAGGWSRSISELRSQGWDIWAYEPHDSAVTSTEPYIIGSKEHLAAMKFDGIFSNNVLEHLRHPIDELQFMAGLLKQDASMAHTTPCFEYLYEYTRFHLFFYLGNSRELLADKAGLKITSFIRDGEFMSAIFQRKQ